jgi:hypothetical protein
MGFKYWIDFRGYGESDKQWFYEQKTWQMTLLIYWSFKIEKYWVNRVFVDMSIY